MFAAAAALNLAVLLVYARFEGNTAGHEWRRKWDAFAAFQAEHKLNSVWLGDSSVEYGIDVAPIDANGFNLGRAGFDPTRLAPLARDLTALPSKPRFAFLSIAPVHLTEDDWTKPWNLPAGLAFGDAMRHFYSEQDSLRPLVWGGSGAVSRLAQRGLDALEARAPLSGFVVSQDVSELKFRVYRANFEMIARFHDELSRAGIRAVWVIMPYRRDLLAAMAGAGSEYAEYSDRRLREIFGADILDLRGAVGDSDMSDYIHVGPGAREALSQEAARRARRQYPNF